MSTTEAVHAAPVLDIGRAPDAPTPPEHNIAMQSSYQRGQADAPLHDADSVSVNEPFREDIQVRDTIARRLASVVQRGIEGLTFQQSIVRDAAEERRRVEVELSQHGNELVRQREAADYALRSAGQINNIAALSAPGTPGEDRFGKKFRFKAAAITMALYLVFGLAELVPNYISFDYMRDDVWITWGLAIGVSVAIIGAAHFLGQTESTMVRVVLLLPLAVVLLGTGLLRHAYTLEKVTNGLQGRDLEVPLYVPAAVGLFALGVPVLFAAAAYVKARRSNTATVGAVGDLRQRVVDQEAAVARLEAHLVARADDVFTGRERYRTIVAETGEAVRAEAGRSMEVLGEYYRGLAHGLNDPAMTARLDRRYFTAVEHARDFLREAELEAILRLDGLALDLIAERPETQSEARTNGSDGRQGQRSRLWEDSPE